MIDSDQLNELWDSIEFNNSTNYDFKRIDGVCNPELSIGYDADHRRCVFLHLKSNYRDHTQNISRKHLGLKYIQSEKCIVLQLNSDQFITQFNELAVSIYKAIYMLDEEVLCFHEFVRVFNEWLELFSFEASDELSEEAVKGMIGELVVLTYLIRHYKRPIDEYIEGWRGPYDEAKDIVLSDKDIEVKTKSIKTVSVYISSEFQLDIEPGKGMELAVVTLLSDPEGITLSRLVNIARELIVSHSGDLLVLRKALMKKGLSIETAKEYDYLCFSAKSLTFYDCTNSEFSCLNSSNVPEGVSKVSYKLSLSSIDKYISSEVDLNGY